MNKGIVLALVAMLFVTEVWAQGCSMCTVTASNLDDNSARGLNGGILYLASLPLFILGTLGYVWWKHYAHSDQSL